MKRFRIGGEEVDRCESSVTNMAGILMLLAGGGGGPHINQGRSSPVRVFECKTCSRTFPSFQALGGHRASHKKPRSGQGYEDFSASSAPRANKMHECSVCGLEFAIGQALGGHMRRHRAEAVSGGLHGKKKVLWLDLNLPAPAVENEVECRKMMGIGVNEIVPILDCFHRSPF